MGRERVNEDGGGDGPAVLPAGPSVAAPPLEKELEATKESDKRES